MQPWIYQNKPLENLSSFKHEPFGFIYKITDPNGKIYIGKKAFFHNITKKLTKKELSTDGRKKTTKVVKTDSKWLTYWGSCKPLLEFLKERKGEGFRREILEIVYTKSQLTYLEVAYQIKEDVLFIDSYNDNILGKFYRKSLITKDDAKYK